MELLRYWRMIQKSLWLIILITLVSLFGMGAYTLTQRVQYQSSVTLLLNPTGSNQALAYVQTQIATNLAASYAQLVSTRSFGEDVAAKLSYPIDPDVVGQEISTALETNTLFFRITARTADPAQAQQLASTVTEVFLTAIANQQSVSPVGNATRERMRTQLQSQLDTLGSQIESYQDQLTELTNQPASTERDDKAYQLQSRTDTLRQAQTSTLLALAQLGQSDTVISPAVVIDQPQAGQPIPKPLARNLLLALLIALPLSLGLAFLRQNLDYTVHSTEELKELLNISALTAIGVIGEGRGRTRYGYGTSTGSAEAALNELPEQLRGKNLVTVEQPRSAASESFRVLRTNIQFSSVDKAVKSLAVTSVSPGDGKSFTAANLAIVLAQAGKRVILVDVDLRKPNVHKEFGLPNTAGFTTLLVNDATSITDVVQRIPGVNNLAIITSGPLPPNPSELLNSQSANDLIRQLSDIADVVILDAPPAGAVTDPVIVATQVDAVVLVIRAGSTRVDLIDRVLQDLRNVGVEAILPVLNRVKMAELRSYYSYTSYYSEDADIKPKGRSGGSSNGKSNEPVAVATAASAKESMGTDRA